ncbi:TetR family transcriptional regulator [Kitasatospora setae]|uniref:Putative TetR family transcriptional regulator n=1 Tax=Kitasatospora setae (strain ATCC 33774 / DSM 43861 / JCM 3304 / KCC A-0304 / NBRC 14216 / KM-6054) TaxID=452652 RepID=E4NAK7_KITSK|nr:putative TetR family transcriptional regulator [Kitasatospora setae KM-6054]
MTAPAAGAAGGPLTPRQAERRRGILRAATALAARGGYEAVQMREVADGARVALGTLYRYFPSKVHLLVAVMREQLERLHEQVRRHPPTGPDPAARVAEALADAFRALQREPRLAEAMVRALSFADRSVGSEVDEVAQATGAIVLAAARLPGPPTAEQQAALRVVGHTWHATLLAWLSGRASLAEVRADLHTAARLLAPAGPGPAERPELEPVPPPAAGAGRAEG